MLQYRAGEPSSTQLTTTVIGQPWHPTYRLGLGIDAVTGQLRASAVKPFAVHNSAPMVTSHVYSLVQSESDLSALIASAAKAAYNIEGITMSASTTFLDRVAVSELSVTLVARARVEGSQYWLASEYELAVTPGSDFRDRYGDYFVAGYRLASSLDVVYECRFRSVNERTAFAARVAAQTPEVLTVDGSTAFEAIAKETSATVSVQVSAHGVGGSLPSPPEGGWDAAQVVTTLLPWFEANQAPDPLDAYLMHYRLLDPQLSGTVPVSPEVFAQLADLYGQFWLVRALVATCPVFGRPLVEKSCQQLAGLIAANQVTLPEDESKIGELTAQTQSVLDTLHEIDNRQAFASLWVAAALTEPGYGVLIDADKGRVQWNYGFAQGGKPGITIDAQRDTATAEWRIGWQEHTFTFDDPTKIIVGWEVRCLWADGHGGDWRKDCDAVIGSTKASVYVKSDYDRGYAWSISWYYVDAELYPPFG